VKRLVGALGKVGEREGGRLSSSVESSECGGGRNLIVAAKSDRGDVAALMDALLIIASKRI
jgi:hypothetical protein